MSAQEQQRSSDKLDANAQYNGIKPNVVDHPLSPPQDSLSEIPLTKSALRELNRRNRLRSRLHSSHPRTRHAVAVQQQQHQPPLAQDQPCPVDQEQLQRFARQGGPDLKDLRGYCQPVDAEMGPGCLSESQQTPTNSTGPHDGALQQQQHSNHRHYSLSNTISATKQQRNAALQETGYRVFSFTLHQDWQPESLKSLKADLERINSAERLIPVELKSQMPPDMPDFIFYSKKENEPEFMAPYRRFPDVDFVSEILQRAVLCLDENEGESSWNLSVHGPILSWVFPSRSQFNLVHVRYCPTATIVREFKPRNDPSQMVDFCIIARPSDESPEHTIIDELCQCRPDKTINHTDWGNLTKDPIAISIETKRHGEGWSKALHQMGTWHSAQWRSLCFGGKNPSHIEFLPGIIVQGHVWTFVATIQRNGRAILFQQVALGDSQSKLGIFKLLVSLQHLHQWVVQTYWPAFQKDILGTP